MFINNLERFQNILKTTLLAQNGQNKVRRDTDKTPSSYAASVKEGLRSNNTVFSSTEGEPFLTEVESSNAKSTASNNSHERHLVAYMTPILKNKLMSIFPDNYVLCNSEEYAWIPQSSKLRKNDINPDQFICSRYLVQFRSPYKNAPPIEGGDYGILPNSMNHWVEFATEKWFLMIKRKENL